MLIGTQTSQESLKITITPQKVDKKFSIETEGMKGVKGMLPLGCLPLWGREGVTLIIASNFIQ